MRGRLLLLLLVGWGAWSYYSDRPIESPPGVLAPESPVQEAATGLAPFEAEGFRITPLARFSATARVLGAERYRFDREADLAPVDLVLGWGPMSDSAHLDQIEITQGNRFYFWRAETLPLPRSAIERNSANMHLIPADALVRRRLLDVRTGQVVTFEGYLVEVVSPDGWRWRSSLTREDTGQGACELVWVEAVMVRDPRG